MEKTCSRCKERKPITDFWKSSASKDGYDSGCKKCRNAGTYRWREQNRDRYLEVNRASARKATYNKVYGLTPEQVEDLRQRQNGKCALCFRPEEPTRVLHVDHDHVTGRVRGLLCSNCNTGIGNLRDDPELLKRAAEYVTAHGS